MTELTKKACKKNEDDVIALTTEVAEKFLATLSGWEFNPNKTEIRRIIEFKNYYRTIAFVNAVAWMAHQEQHHPDLAVSYNHCVVRYQTHTINGLSENDFICAAKVDAIYKQELN